MTTTPAPLGLLLDVDGPIASPVSRSIAIPSIATDLARLANAGIPVAFNTGRSDAFIRDVVVPPLLEAGLNEDAHVYAICEKGAVWFRIGASGIGEIVVDEELALPEEYGRAVERLVDEEYSELVFFDHTKRAMVSVEQHIEVDSKTYLAEQAGFDEKANALLTERGFGTVRLDDTRPASDGSVTYRIDPTIISTDIESVRLGKDLGAERLVALLEEDGVPLPEAWRTMGDSRTDYAMADWLHARGWTVEHIDVRPADGVPETPYPVRTHPEAIHDESGAAFISEWADAHAA